MGDRRYCTNLALHEVQVWYGTRSNVGGGGYLGLGLGLGKVVGLRYDISSCGYLTRLLCFCRACGDAYNRN